jgi:acetyl-CoA carboxylase biotin carboxyl carrier protein
MVESDFDDPLEVANEQAEAGVISIEQLQRLVQLIDASDVSELELEQASEGVHLVLRKARASEGADTGTAARVAPVLAVPAQAAPPSAAPTPTKEAQTEYNVSAPLVGTFHVWAKPKGGALVAVGDHVKAGQLVGTIQSLNVLNEVETSVAGRVVKVHVHDGQPVEYGQILMTIESSDGAKGA